MSTSPKGEQGDNFGDGVGTGIVVGVGVGLGFLPCWGGVTGVMGGVMGRAAMTLFTFKGFSSIANSVAGIKSMNKHVMIDLMLKRIIFLLLIFLPLFFIPQAYNKYELSKVLLLRACIDLLFIVLIFGSISQRKPIVKWGRVGVGVGVFLGVSYLASVLGVDFGQSVFGTYFRNQGMITLLHYAMFFVILSSLEVKDFEAVFNGLIGGAILVSSLVLVQFIIVRMAGEAGAETAPLQDMLFNGRYHLTFGNPNFLGAYLAICMPIGVWRALKDKRIWAGVILMIVGIILSGSRGAIIASIISIIQIPTPMSNVQFSITKLQKIFISLLFLIMVISSAMFLYANNRASLYEDRGTIWGAGIRAFVQRPILGWGLENFEYAYKGVVKEPWLLNVKVDKAHNELIEVIVASGIVGLLAYFYLLWVVFKNLNSLGRAVLASFVVLSLTNVLSVTSYVVFWVLAGMAAVNEEKRKEFTVDKIILFLIVVICLYLLIFNIENAWRDIMLRNALGNIFTFVPAS